jgi:hypothetical protein
MPLNPPSRPPILVIVRESPLHQRTAVVLQSIVTQEPPGLADVVMLSVRRPHDHGVHSNGSTVRRVIAEDDWLGQILRLVEESGCRWVVLPSSVDRYLPGAFATVLELGSDESDAIVFGCRVRRGMGGSRVGPSPFRFDYFALLSGFNYIAPGATFMSTRRLTADRGFDPRFPNAVAYEYLLRTGAAPRIASCEGPFLETEAHPFPGVPEEYAALHAMEAMLVAMNYNRSSFSPGATLSLVSVLADRLEAASYADQEQDLAGILTGTAGRFTERYLRRIGFCDEGGGRLVDRSRTIWDLDGDAPLHARGRHTRFRALSPPPVWEFLRRVKRGWKAFRASVD